MALSCKLRPLLLRRHRFSSTSDSENILTAREKTRAALSLIRSEQNPDRILDICRSITVSPASRLDRALYTTAVSKLRESNRHDAIRSLINDSMNHPNCNSERLVSHFIFCYGQAGLFADALKLFDEMPERNVKTLNSLLFSALSAREYSEMKRVFAEFPAKYGLNPNLDTYNIYLDGFCRSGNANQAHSIIAEMERNGIKPNATTFVTAIAGFYKEHSFVEVGKMTNLMKKYSMKPGINIYTVRIQSLCKLKRSNEAKALLDGILEKGMKPNSAIYKHLIHGFCREGKMEGAMRLFMEMVDKGLEPGAECYFTLIHYLCASKEFEVALRICKECMSKGWVPNLTTMKLLVDGIVRVGKVSEAKEMIGHVKRKFTRNLDSWSEIEESLPG